MKRWFLILALCGSAWAQGHVLAPVNGGTGDNTLTLHGVLLGQGTSAVTAAGPATAGWCLIANGVLADPSFQACPGVTSIQPQNNGVNYGSPQTGAVVMNFANCTVSATFTITCPSPTTYSGIAPIAVTGSNISIQNATPANVTAAYGFGTGFAALSTAGVASGNLVIGDANTGIMDSGELNLNVANHVVQNTSDTQTWSIHGGSNGAHNAAMGALHLAGANQTGVGGASSKGGELQIRGGNNAGTNTASQAGWVYVEPGSSTAGGFQGGLLLHHVYAKGGGTSTQWYMQCLTASQMTVNDCGASPQNWLGIAHDVSGTTVNVHVPPSESPASASAAVTLGHTVCLGAASPQVTDSGGTSSCTSAQGVTVGVVIATSGTVDIGDGTSVTFSTTLPLVSMNTAQSGSPGGTFTTVNGTTNQINSSAPSGPSTTLSLSSTLLFPGTITMGANAADFASATSFKIPSYAGGVTAADGTIAFNTTAKSFHGYQNGADAIFATYKSAPTNGQCATWVTDGTTFVLGSVACAAGTVTSVAATGDGTVLNSTVTGSPITGSGTLAFSLANAASNTIFGNWTSGSTTPSYNTMLSGGSCGDATHATGWTAGTGFFCQSISGSGGTVTGTSTQYYTALWSGTSSLTGTAPVVNGLLNSTSLSAYPAYTVTPVLGTDNSVAGTLQVANGAANAHTKWASGATTSNTVAGPATVITTGNVIDSSSTGTTTTLHDSGLATAAVVTSASGTSPITVTGSGTNSITVACHTCVTGPTNNIIGGIIGAVPGTSSTATNYNWFAPGPNRSPVIVFPFAMWITGMTIYNQTANGPGNFQQVGLTQFGSTTANVQGPFMTVPQNAAGPGVFQNTGLYWFRDIGDIASISIEAVAPTGGSPGSINAISAYVIGTSSQFVSGTENRVQVSAGATVYGGPSQAGPSSTEGNVVVPMPYATTAKNLCIYMAAAQPAGGSLVTTLRTNLTTDTALTVTVPLSGGISAYCDNTHTVNLVAGDLISWKIVNNAPAASSGNISEISMELTSPGGSTTGMIIFGMGANNGPSSGSTAYTQAFTGSTSGALSTTEANEQAPAPRAFTAKNLYCYIKTAPGTNPVVITLRDATSCNPTCGAAGDTALTVTASTSSSGTTISDTTHSASIANKDLFDLSFFQTSGTTPFISACSMETD